MGIKVGEIKIDRVTMYGITSNVRNAIPVVLWCGTLEANHFGLAWVLDDSGQNGKTTTEKNKPAQCGPYMRTVLGLGKSEFEKKYNMGASPGRHSKVTKTYLSFFQDERLEKSNKTEEE